ncbi:DUF1906 domain-containing protein [Crenobacter sp. SG2305]|uniref:glycoside hydrolase domain-containing protein n=1 Tax=Crenobacter oryzisoli TaxID=3056844 RepID=UPI0025AACB04|nr:glycoside hydrolase domain-containing protein [Crenobacter sp. SG2305]MDN0084655.1 DUF1906 domain-containing protein [Crenobacter sp. SG2305]
MTTIIDVSSSCGSRASALAAAGIRTVIRYYSRDTIRPSKRLTQNEAVQLASSGLRLGIVHEGRFGDSVANFDRACGVADALYARNYGARVIGQPAASAIYFAVDFDATAEEIRTNIIPYFQGIADVFSQATDEPSYVIGIYGSGATCKAVLDAGLAQYAWLAQSVGWSGYTDFHMSNRWALSQEMPTVIAGVACDPNSANDSKMAGDFAVATLEPAEGASTTPETSVPPPVRMRINARVGLRLRSGPGVEFDVLKLLPFGTIVHPLKTVGTWSSIDLQGDGISDGFVSNAYLVDVAQPSVTQGTTPSPNADAIHVAELIRQGSSEEGLKVAREKAAASLPGYPTNGCAAHLSALLQQSGIDVAMTWGAGKLAQVLIDRGWSRISVGNQKPGDVGVCFDNDPSPAGADHIYLVVGTSGPDEMMIADNQRTVDAPHIRFASGQGKTPTEYFLRAL